MHASDGGTAPLWDIALPSWPSRIAGVCMAGFRDRSASGIDLVALPHPAVTLLLDVGDGVVIEDAHGRRIRGSAVAGLAPGAIRGRGRGIECIQVRLSPVIAHAVLGASGVPAVELNGAVVGLGDVWGREAERLQASVRAAAAWDERFAIVEAALARRCEAGRHVAPEVARAWQRIVGSGGQLRVDELATEVGWSHKRLWSRFRSQIGRTPKYVARLVRFDHAAHRLAAGQAAARVAAEAGYADQSHLHREVRDFTGATPSAVAVAPWLAVDDVAWATRGVSDRHERAAIRGGRGS